MMAFGFVVARFGLFLQELAPLHPNATPPSGGLSLWFGTTLIVLGVIANLLAARDHFLFLRRLDRGEPYRPPRWSLGVAVAVVLAAGGVVMAVYLIALHRWTSSALESIGSIRLWPRPTWTKSAGCADSTAL